MTPTKYPTRLAANIQDLPIDDALDVYAAASQQEKKQVRHAVLSKIMSYYNSVSQGKKPLGEYRALASLFRSSSPTSPSGVALALNSYESLGASFFSQFPSHPTGWFKNYKEEGYP